MKKGVVTETEFIATTLLADKNYAWEVRPFNWGYFCADFSEKVLFSTNSAVATQEIEGVEGIQVFPTMVSNGQSLNIEFESTQNIGAAQITLTSLAGVEMQTQEVVIQNGQNQYALIPENLSSGIYIIGVTTAKGSVYQKVVLR